MNIERLKKIREDKDYKQSDIAKVLNTTQQQYSKYELGLQVIPVERLVKLAKFYNTSVDYLIGLTNERKPYPKA
jgi:hypothetical protein